MNSKMAVASWVVLVGAGLVGSGSGCASTRPTVPPAVAEQAACAEVPDADRDQGPFARRDRIVRVEELQERANTKVAPHPVGAAVYVRAAPGMTEQWLGRVIECHLAHRATLGGLAADRDSSPFAEDSRVSVSSTPTAFRVAITSSDLDTARSVIARAERLVVQ
jgi:hypothetical protein